MKMTITQQEFNGWVYYLNNKGPDVEEIQLAVLTNMVAQGLGSKKSKVTDYIISKTHEPKSEPTDTKVMSASAVKAAFSSLI